MLAKKGSGGWGRDFGQLRHELEYRYEDQGTKKFINVLLLLAEHDEAVVDRTR